MSGAFDEYSFRWRQPPQHTITYMHSYANNKYEKLICWALFFLARFICCVRCNLLFPKKKFFLFWNFWVSRVLEQCAAAYMQVSHKSHAHTYTKAATNKKKSKKCIHHHQSRSTTPTTIGINCMQFSACFKIFVVDGGGFVAFLNMFIKSRCLAQIPKEKRMISISNIFETGWRELQHNCC